MRTDIKIDPEFKALLPPLTIEELAKLEFNLKEDGCREPLMVWNGYLVDGHNRYDICTRLQLPFQVNYIDKPDRDSAMLWMLGNQGGRRNLADIDRIAIAKKREVIIARQAKENHSANGGNKAALAMSPTPLKINTRAESAKAAGVGEKKYDEGKVILAAIESGEIKPEVMDQIRTGKKAIHTVAREIKESRKPTEEYVAPEEPSKPAKLGKLVHDMTGQFLPVAILHIDRIADNDVGFERAMKEIIAHCEKRLANRKK